MSRVATIITRMNPLHWVVSPIMDLELRTAGRRGWTYIYRFGYVLMALFIMTITALAMTEELDTSSAAARLQSLSTMAPRIALVIGWMQVVSLTFFAPALTAPTICDEKTKRTLPSLATTPLDPAQIVIGKLFGRMVQLFILALVSLPLLLLIRVFGGLEIEPILAMTAIALSCAMLSGSLGVFFALGQKRARTAMVKALLAMTFYCALPVLQVAYSLWVLGTPPSARSLIIWAHINPPAVMGLTTASVLDPTGMPALIPLRQIWLSCAGVALGLSAIVCSLATVRLRSVIRIEVGGRVSRKALKKAVKANAGEGDEVIRRHGSRTVWNSVVLWRESRMGIRLRSFMPWFFAIMLGAIFVPLYVFAPLDEPGPHIAITVICTLAQLLIATQITVGAIAGERDAKTWDVLLTTALTPRQILRGKWLGGSIRLLPIPVFLAIHWGMFHQLRYVHWIGVATIPLFVLCYGLFLSSTGLWLSLRCKKSLTASVLNLGVALTAWLLLPLLAAFVIGGILDGGGEVGEFIATLGASMHPVFMVVMSAVQASEAAGRTNSAVRTFEFIDNQGLSATTFGAIYWASSLAALCTAWIVLFWTVRLFPSRSGRSS
jgi:ABC-type transport system involved in multi-copper enzyme maturation permease subunit